MKTKLIILIALFLIIQRAVAQEDKLITIPQGIAMVLRDSRLIKIAGLDNEIAYQESLISRSALLPHLSILMSKTFNQYQPKQKFGSQTVPIADKEPFSLDCRSRENPLLLTANYPVLSYTALVTGLCGAVSGSCVCNAK